MKNGNLGRSPSAVPSHSSAASSAARTPTTAPRPALVATSASTDDDMTRRVEEAKRRVAAAQSILAVKDNPYMVLFHRFPLGQGVLISSFSSRSSLPTRREAGLFLSLLNRAQDLKWPLIPCYWTTLQSRHNLRRTDINPCNPNLPRSR